MKKLAERAFLILKFQALTRILFARKIIHERLRPHRHKDALMVNIGGGLFFRPYWKILDYVSPYYSFPRYYIDFDVDLMTSARFPFADGTVDCFYSAHTLEHVPQEYCGNLIAEIHRCLRPGGVVRLNMPDYDKIRNAAAMRDGLYFRTTQTDGLSFEQAVVEQIASSMLSVTSSDQIRSDYETMSPEMFADHYCGRASRELQKQRGGDHINWFNFDKLGRLLKEAGFSEVYRSEPQGSRFAELRGEGGWLAHFRFFEINRMLGFDTTWPEKSLYVEAVK